MSGPRVLTAPSLVEAAMGWRTDYLLARRAHFARVRDDAEAQVEAIDDELVVLERAGALARAVGQ